MFHMACTRFNDTTWEENCKYRNRTGVAVVYGTEIKLPSRISPGQWLVVFEMNNTTNRIMGIGLISSTQLHTTHTIYSDSSYNLHIYRGNYWMGREDIESFDPSIIRDADSVLFKGRSHMKRLSGISILSEKPFSHWPGISLRSLRNRIRTLMNVMIRLRPSRAS
jgi:hypothetical protein